MKIQVPFALAAMASTLALISCGGGGGGGSSQLSSTGRAVQNVQRLSVLSMANSGIAIAPFMLSGHGGGGGTTGTTGGGGFVGGGVPSLGFFFRDFGGPGGLAAMSRTRGEDGGGATTGTNGGPQDSFYYDEWLQLWVDIEWTETNFNIHFYQDEAGTLPAGHVSSSYTGDWGNFPQIYHNEYEFTAGPLAGSHGSYDCIQTSWSEGNMVYEETYADGSKYEGESQWTNETSTWSSRWDGPNNVGWFQDNGTWSMDGSGTYSCSNSEGWSSTWNYNSDWSGSAHFEGPDPKLPADMTWTSDGHYKVVYADGSVEEWSWEDFWNDVEGGTTGTGGFSPTSP